MTNPTSKEQSSIGAVRIRDMPWEDLLKLLRTIGPEVGRLMNRGDQTAKRLMARYVYAHAHPKDVEANKSLRAAIEDYVNRDLRVSEQIDLGSRFGHRLPEPEKDRGPLFFVPDVTGPQ